MLKAANCRCPQWSYSEARSIFCDFCTFRL